MDKWWRIHIKVCLQCAILDRDPTAILMATWFGRQNQKESTNSLRGFWCSAKYQQLTNWSPGMALQSDLCTLQSTTRDSSTSHPSMYLGKARLAENGDTDATVSSSTARRTRDHWLVAKGACSTAKEKQEDSKLAYCCTVLGIFGRSTTCVFLSPRGEHLRKLCTR